MQLKHDKIILRSLTDNDKDDLARLANNKKIWDNLRDIMPHRQCDLLYQFN